MAHTTIQIETDLRDRLRSLGSKGETYGEIIKKLIDKANYVQFMKESYDILENEDRWVLLDEL